jgi:ssDNA-binding replication factor A large subunit
MQNYDLLIGRVAKSAGLDKEEVERRVEAKKAKLSGLISKEGAAQIIAAELGISFEDQELKISELMPGMRKANVVGKIINLFPVREFEKNGRSGKVANIIIADDTGNTRVVLWDTNHISLIEDGTIKQDDVVEIRNGATRDNEIHLSGFSEFKKSDKVMGEVQTEKMTSEKTVEEIQQGQSVKIRGTIVQIFQPRFYSVCPECNKKVAQDGEGFSCNEHGKVQPKDRAILNFVLDDGTETVRIVMFSDQINILIPEEDLKDPEKAIAFRDDLLGTEFYISGSVKKNQFFNNLEIVASGVEKVDVEKLIVELEARG